MIVKAVRGVRMIACFIPCPGVAIGDAFAS